MAISPDGQEVWAFGGHGPVRLAGLGAGPLAGAVDGRRTLPEIVAQAVQDGMRREDAQRLIDKWVAAGHLRPVQAAQPTHRRARIRVQGSGADRLRPLLMAVDVVERDADLELIVVEDLLEAANLHPGTMPRVLVALSGPRMIISPVLHERASCPECLVARLSVRRSVDVVASRRVGREWPPPSPQIHEAGLPVVAGVLVAIAHEQDGGVHADHVTVIDPITATTSLQRLVPLGGCRACDPQGRSVSMTHLDGVPDRPGEDAGADLGAGLRVVDPEQTWERYAHLVGDVVGVVPDVRQRGPAQFRAFGAGANVAAANDLSLMQSKLRSGSGGKGTTMSAARAGALAEALERDSLRARGGEPFRRGRWEDMDDPVHPNDIQLFSDEQLHRSAQLLALGIQDPAATGFHRVPIPFDIDAEHDWTEVSDLRTGQIRELPSSLVWFGWPGLPAGYPLGCSNGAAAGNTIPEALLQGLLELVERDSVALWWYTRSHRPAVDLTGWDDPRILAAVAPQKAMGTDFWVLDLTADLGIPAAAAIATGVGPAPSVPIMGFGAHVDPTIAVVRALTELAQMQAPISMLSADDHLEIRGPAERDWFEKVKVDSEPWLGPHGTVPPATLDGPVRVNEALDDLVERFTRSGLQVLWADCTRPEIGLPVVRTWVPGMRHFWRRTAPGRLYEIPPALGWCEPGYGQADLNPRTMIL